MKYHLVSSISLKLLVMDYLASWLQLDQGLVFYMGYPRFKPNVPLCPVFSSINSHSFNIAKFLVPLLRPIFVSQYSINDTFSFLQELFEQKFNISVAMASFDVVFNTREGVFCHI